MTTTDCATTTVRREIERSRALFYVPSPVHQRGDDFTQLLARKSPLGNLYSGEPMAGYLEDGQREGWFDALFGATWSEVSPSLSPWSTPPWGMADAEDLVWYRSDQTFEGIPSVVPILDPSLAGLASILAVPVGKRSSGQQACVAAAYEQDVPATRVRDHVFVAIWEGRFVPHLFFGALPVELEAGYLDERCCPIVPVDGPGAYDRHVLHRAGATHVLLVSRISSFPDHLGNMIASFLARQAR